MTAGIARLDHMTAGIARLEHMTSFNTPGVGLFGEQAVGRKARRKAERDDKKARKNLPRGAYTGGPSGRQHHEVGCRTLFAILDLYHIQKLRLPVSAVLYNNNVLIVLLLMTDMV